MTLAIPREERPRSARRADGVGHRRRDDRKSGHGLVLGATPQERQRAYRRARRHTVMVRILRVLLPIAIVGCFSFYAIPSKLRIEPIPGGPTVTVDLARIASGTLTRPTFDGYTADNAHYEVSAATAIQDLAQAQAGKPPDEVKLDQIAAKLTQVDKSWVEMKASRGTILVKAQKLRLEGGIDVTTSDAMRMELAAADVDFATQRLASEAAVAITMPTGTVTATGLDVDVAAKTLVFRSSVSAKLRGNGTPPQPRATPLAGTSDPLAPLQNQSGPIDITAARLEIRDGEKSAVFSGGVVAQRPDSSLAGDSMRVLYAARAGTPVAGAAAALTGGSASDITALDVTGNVRLSASDGRTASAEQLSYDRVAGTLALIGNVAVAQDNNILRGGRVDIDIARRHTRVSGPGRVAGRFEQSAQTPPVAAAKRANGGTPQIVPAADSGPIDIEADTLDVFDQRGIATFVGQVVARRGTQQITAERLDLVYVAGALDATPAAAASAEARLKRMEAHGKVAVKAPNNQTVTGRYMLYEAGSSVITVSGDVVVTGGSNVIRGEKLVVDLRSGITRFIDSGTQAAAAQQQGAKPKKGRISAIITQDGFKQAEPEASPAATSGNPPVRKPASKPVQNQAKKPLAKPVNPNETGKLQP